MDFAIQLPLGRLKNAVLAEPDTTVRCRLLQSLAQHKGLVRDRDWAPLLEEFTQSHTNTAFRTWCHRYHLKLTGGAQRASQEASLLSRLRNQSAQEVTRMEALKAFRLDLLRMPSVMEWMGQIEKHGEGQLRDMVNRVLSELQSESGELKQIDAELKAPSRPVQDLTDFQRRSELERLTFILENAFTEDSAKWLLNDAAMLLKREDSPLVLQVYLHILAHSMVCISAYREDLLAAILKLQVKTAESLELAWIFALGALCQKARYRGQIYPLLREFSQKSEPVQKAAALMALMPYTPNEAQTEVRVWLQSARTLKDVANLQWLFATEDSRLEELKDDFETQRQELLLKAKRTRARGQNVTESTCLLTL